MKIIELLPIKEWEEKDGDKPTGNIRLYIGQIHVGTFNRKNKSEELYSFDSHYEGVTRGINTYTYRPLEDIKIEVECAWKEHASKFIKSLKTFVSTTDVKRASISRQLNSPDKKDANEKQ